MDRPGVAFARAQDGAYLAYQVFGDGPIDLVWQDDFFAIVDEWWDAPTERAVYENLTGFPRAWVVDDYRVADREATRSALADDAVDLRRTVLLEREPPITPVAGDTTAPVTVEDLSDDASSFSVDLDRPGILVVSEVYYPAWKATVDGSPAPILRANRVLRAIALPAGRHRIEFRYDRSLLEKSAAVSAVTFLLTLLAIVGSLVSRRKEALWKRSS